MANRSLSNSYSDSRSTRCDEYQGPFKPVQHNLALTPRKVKELTDKGIAVSLSAAQTEYTHESERGNFDIDPLYQRGTDHNTLWENAQRSKEKIIAARDKVSKAKRAEMAEKAKNS